MQRGRVVGSVWATRRVEVLEGVRLALVRRRGPDGRLLDKEEVAIEVVEAGIGAEVLLADGREASLAMPEGKSFAPVDLAVVGVLDRQDWEED
ncbi:EutN/CcmL family microcompartment protein [bacterium]|nr:EutN/CcmL family microcompartment protein [bacterium]